MRPGTVSYCLDWCGFSSISADLNYFVFRQYWPSTPANGELGFLGTGGGGWEAALVISIHSCSQDLRGQMANCCWTACHVILWQCSQWRESSWNQETWIVLHSLLKVEVISASLWRKLQSPFFQFPLLVLSFFQFIQSIRLITFGNPVTRVSNYPFLTLCSSE